MLKQRYKLVKLLGEGVYGCVYLCQDTRNGDRKVALKKQKPNFMDAQEGYSISLLREVNILQELGNKNSALPELVEAF